MSMSVPFVDLTRVHTELRGEFEAAFASVLDSGWFLLGEQTKAFELEFAMHEGRSSGIACGSGSDALLLALKAYEIGPGDAVATVANSFVATAESIARSGAKVLLVDSDPRTRCMDPEDLARLLDEPEAEALRAIIPVHLYGRPADIASLRAVLEAADRSDVQIIGDAAQAHGSPGLAGLTELTCYSFYPGKNLGALGDGGMVLSDNEELLVRIRSLRNHGRAGKHSVGTVGLNSRFDEVQAAILRIKLRNLRAYNAGRRATAEAYRERLTGLDGLVLPEDVPEHVYHLFAVELPTPGSPASSARRDAVGAALAERGIGTGQHYPVAVHEMPPYPSARVLSVSEALSRSVLSLPMFPGLRLDEVEYVCHSLREVLEEMEESP